MELRASRSEAPPWHDDEPAACALVGGSRPRDG